MDHYEEVYQKLREQYTDEEIAEGFMIPATLTKEEQKISDEEFKRIRFELLNNRTEKQRLMSEITRLRISINNYLEQEIYSPSFFLVKNWKHTLPSLKSARNNFQKKLIFTTLN